MSELTIKQICDDLAISARNSALEAASRVARLYGAPEEACQHILMLKGRAIETPLSRKEPV